MKVKEQRNRIDPARQDTLAFYQCKKCGNIVPRVPGERKCERCGSVRAQLAARVQIDAAFSVEVTKS